MASLLARCVTVSARRGLHVSAVSCANKMMADPLEHATGLEKQELLAKAAGNDNPFDMRVYKRVSGDKSNPTVVPSFYEKRLVGCICEEDATCINWMWLEKGETKRCECGYWFQLAEGKPMV
ncbi:cytochrome c oxidase subunit 5B, mitochondrial-like [Portunus trituberculatus]|uniref:Cytochrome c oxidase subunit 5B, mitochondrial n=1 Tax=Portunus trituberculatus TaxID=210409 RepID=A0A5B7DSE3_PORTR|nr:cytochrome c oxidase subunit 5B, mitochondrial-like [Portunus trituberculatus]MPC24004.1 Cytochrome c oxidase subunit 5B, mitochondrial [Portunus trituberculatus]